MAMLSFGGIDVSKDRLDVMLLPEEKCASVSNDAAGWTKLVEQLRGFSIGAIGLEASGGYERGVMRALLAELPKLERIDVAHRHPGPHDRLITSPARASSVGSIERIILGQNPARPGDGWYFVGACTGRSAGFSPFRIRST
jgi:hypothetical protein